MSSTDRKPGFFQKLFGRSKSSSSTSEQQHSASPSTNKKDTSHVTNSREGASSEHPPKTRNQPPALKIQTPATASGNGDGRSPNKLSPSPAVGGSSPRPTTTVAKQTSRSTSSSTSGGNARPKKGGKHRKRGNKSDGKKPTSIDTRKPLEYPATPEMILAYHQARPFLNKNEEWLLVELNEFECLVDGIDIVRTIAKHSKFFEVEPDELWEEFFEYVDEVPSYDEVINFDVWQEFRDNKYPC